MPTDATDHTGRRLVVVQDRLAPLAPVERPCLKARLAEPELVRARLCRRYSRGSPLAATQPLSRCGLRLCGRLRRGWGRYLAPAVRDQPRWLARHRARPHWA